LKYRIAAVSAAIMVPICALVTEAVLEEQHAAFEHARVDAAHLSATFEEQVRGALTGVAGAMEFVKGRIEAEGPAFDLNAWKARVPELVSPAIQSLIIVGADGKVLGTARDHDSKPVSLSGRDFFAAHRDNPNLGFFIGRPVSGKISKHPAIPATRRLNTKDGQFAGVLSFFLDPKLLTSSHQKIHLGEAASMTLVASDGTTLARYTGAKGLDQASIGKEAADFDPATSGAHANSGEYSRRSSIDGISRLYHWRRVPGYPLFVVAGLGEAEMLAGANFETKIIIGLGVAALSLPIIMMFMFSCEISRRVEYAAASNRESEKVRREHGALLAITEELARERVKLRKTNAELLSERRRAEEASRAKSAFLANMSHELRTPLNAILGFSEIIRDKFFGDDVNRYAAYAADIHCSGTHLLNIVNDILDVTKIEAGKQELREEQVKLEAVILESLLSVAQQAAKGGLSLTSDCPDIGVSVFGDRTKIIQTFINLLSNAIKFTPPGGSVRIAAALEADGSLNLTVRDTGIGMSSSEIRDALELFRQVDNSLARKFQGTGLGLPLAVQLTELHGGSVTIDSTPGAGTSVIVRFPAERISREVCGALKQRAASPVEMKMAS
ncbi:MAG: hypothetical protein HY765_03730, partial [Rhodomicrobium sp.]|nr:hypothetical protein [Rhodomicrobium sp.]